MSLLIDVPPAAVSMPTEVTAAESASICDSVSPALVPAAAMFWAMSTMRRSFVAKLLPRATITEPRLLKNEVSMPVTAVNCASIVAASSDVRLVATPRFAITSVKGRRLSFAMPSCPATSAIPASSVAARGISADICLMLSPIAVSSSVVRSVVLATPAMALSNSMDASTHALSSSAIFLSAAVIPAAVSAWDSSPASLPASFASLPNSSMELAHLSALFSASSR